jgi:hypothetical protein
LEGAALTAGDFVPDLLRQKTLYEAQLCSLPQPAQPSPYLGDARNYSSNAESKEYQRYLLGVYDSQVDKIKREQIETVDNLFQKASHRVKEGMETLKGDVRKWDGGLFEPESFELAIFKKKRRDRDLEKTKAKMEKIFGTQKKVKY